MTENRQHQDHRTGLSSGQGAPTFRLRAAADDAGIVAIYNLQDAGGPPLTIARYRMEHAEQGTARQGEQWVAVEANSVVGVGSLAPAWWSAQRGGYLVEIRIDQGRWRQGMGSELYRLLQSRLSGLEATHLLGWVRADAQEGRHFAARLGFRETGEVIEEYRLHLPDAYTDAYAGLEMRLESAGLRIASLAELGPADEAFLRALQQLWADAGDAPPDPASLATSFPSWRREVLDAWGLSRETHWVALDGGRPVGMTFLKRLGEDAAENDYTGVAKTHRGRGIAQALKLRAISWARQQGVRWFYTSSEVGNSRMIAINRRLGYQSGVRRLAVARDLP
jgi:GNAT superfamily N-acetyltransferase